MAASSGGQGATEEALLPGERVVGEWLAQAHGTRYDLPHEPFVPFDIMRGTERMTYWNFHHRVAACDFTPPSMLAMGSGLPIRFAMDLLGQRHHGAVDPPEGAIWRVESEKPGGSRRVEFLAKYVRPDFEPGRYLPEITGGEPVWNWRP